MRENWYRMVSSGHFEFFVSLLFLALTGKCLVLNTVLDSLTTRGWENVMINVGIIYSLENNGKITETLHVTRSRL